MERPGILISGSPEGCESYIQAIAAAGGAPVGVYCPALDMRYDGLLLAGGGDVEPSRFGQENAGSAEIDLARDDAELALAKAYLEAGKPILGICRGHQVLNIALGGTLIQDLGTVGNLFHQKLPEAKEDKLHPVRCGENSLLYRLYGPLAMVNSFHHQAVDHLGQGLKATAWSEGGIVEAMEHETLPIISVQFHPERMSYEKRRADAVDGRFLFEEFIALCKEYRTKERSAPGR